MRRSGITVLGALVGGLLLLAGCTAPPPPATAMRAITPSTPDAFSVPADSRIPCEVLYPYGYYLKRPSAVLWVITGPGDFQRPPMVEWHTEVPPQREPPPELAAIDYTRSFAVVVFNGERSGESYQDDLFVRGVRRVGDTVVIYVHFYEILPDQTVQPTLVSKDLALKFDRDALGYSGNVTFVAVDQNGKERTAVRALILPASGNLTPAG